MFSYPRSALPLIEAALARQPAVALLGPRQVGKTTLARQIAETRPSVYLDLEDPADVARLTDARAYLSAQAGKLVVLDEIHRAPGLFPVLRGLIDEGRRQGRRTGQFLVLGSAALELLRQSGETLAGRIAFIEMGPLTITEVGESDRPSVRDKLWLRGGFPESFDAATDGASLAWRRDLVRTYLEREVAQFGPRLPAEMLRRLWTMLAHNQGQLFNASQLAASLGVSAQTVTRYVDLLCDLLLVRRLTPVMANVGKRLVKAPKLYVRDTGLLHALLGVADADVLAGHPVRGPSFEGFVIEHLISAMALNPNLAAATPGFYRTAAGAELDLVIEQPGAPPLAIEIKASSAPTVTKGFHLARADLARADIARRTAGLAGMRPALTLVVHAGEARFPMGDGVEAMGLADAVAEVRAG